MRHLHSKLQVRCSVSFIILLAAAVSAQAQTPIRGFPPSAWTAERELEQKAQAQPEPTYLRQYMEKMAAAPHHAGSIGSKNVADYLLSLAKSWDLDARIETFEALMPYPITRVVEMTSPVRFRAALNEPPIAVDPETNLKGALPPFNAYSASGDVTAPIVYVNYGLPEDYTYLKSRNIDVRGKIVVVRYGRTWRGSKPLLAQQRGAVACLIYSDPRDDGFYSEDAYPQGSMRPAEGVQRGSVIDMPLYPGDPLSPGFASEPGVKRLPRDQAQTILKIPVLPLSWADAKPLLEQLRGPLAPESWRGALPITYHIGPGPATVHMRVDFDWTTKPLHNVIITIPGTTEKDQWVLYGNHHDAWVTGASDPGSGASVLLETARSLSVLLKQGWRPKRTIVLALWDGEEFGLLGSTEWVEKHFDELKKKAVVYINTDSTGTGGFSAGGSPTLNSFLQDVLHEVRDPRTVAEPGQKHAPFQPIPATTVGSLGAGSDYVAFLDHAGIASLHVGFGASIGQYHSAYDTVRFYDQFQDVDRRFGVALSQVLLTSLLRLSNATVLPFEIQNLSTVVRSFVEEIRRQLPQGSAPPAVDLGELNLATLHLSVAAQTYDSALAMRVTSLLQASPIPTDVALKVNQILQRLEQTFAPSEGIPDRGWYRHQLYAPGLSTGYAAITLPALREPVEAHKWPEAAAQAHKVAKTIEDAANLLEQATELLQ